MSLWNAFRIVSLLLALAAVSVAQAEEGEEEMIGFGQERFQLNLGYYHPNFNTGLSAGTSQGPGIIPPGYIDLENDLGLDSSLGVGRISGYWRFFDRHRLYFGYYKLNRKSARPLLTDIGPIYIPELGINDTILAGSNVRSVSAWEVYHLGYGYSFYKSESLELAAKLGLGLARIKLDVSGTLNTLNNGTLTSTAGASVLVPLPTVGVTLDWVASERWTLKGNAGYFKVSVNGVKAGVTDAGVAAEYRLFRNFGIGAGYSLLWLNADIDRSDYFGSIGWRTGGLQLYGVLIF